ncbi:hypothetical protein ABZY01_32570 [Streptomyces anthocyanicus]|uniref:hypothetical protein n=1 Tax=Streptomyces anthocyanicus TaxID=68174 RepID=UPI0033A3E633
MTPMLYAPDRVCGITIRQPWAACILHGDKRREQAPPLGTGWRLLHAGADIDRAALRDPVVARTVRGLVLPPAVIGIIRITGSHTDTGEPCSAWAQPDCVHMDLDDVHALALPVPCGGQLGPWRVPLAVYERVLLQLPPHLHELLPEASS